MQFKEKAKIFKEKIKDFENKIFSHNLLLLAGAILLCITSLIPRLLYSCNLPRLALQRAEDIEIKTFEQKSSAEIVLAKYKEKTEEEKRIEISRHGMRGSGITLSDALTAEQIDNFLKKYSSPMAGMGKIFVDAGRKYGVNPAVVIAIAGKESTFGKHAPGYNAWGWGHKRWSSWEEAINCYTFELRKKYIDGWRCETIDDLNRRYNGHASWSSGVKHFYEELMNTKI